MKIYYLIIFSISLDLTKYKVVDVSSSSHFQNVPYKQGKERKLEMEVDGKWEENVEKKKKREIKKEKKKQI